LSLRSPSARVNGNGGRVPISLQVKQTWPVIPLADEVERFTQLAAQESPTVATEMPDQSKPRE